MLTFEQFRKRTSKPTDDLPPVIVLKRKSIRMFSDGRKVAIYRVEELGIDVVFPMMFGINQGTQSR